MGLNIRVKNPNVVMSIETNPEVLTVLYKHCRGKMSDETFLLKDEAKLFTSDDFYVDNSSGIFKNSNIRHFEEFEAFTGIKSIPKGCFYGCKSLKEITLPESIVEIKENAFYDTGLEYLYIPLNVEIIDQSAFVLSKIKAFTVDLDNFTFYSHGNHIYKGMQANILYILAPETTEYVMPETTVSVYGDGSKVWASSQKLEKIVLNEKVQNISGKWFNSVVIKLQEVSGPIRDDVEFYNGCIYSKDCSTLIYYPSNKEYSETLLNPNVTVIGKYAFVSHKKLKKLVIPEKIVKIEDSAFYISSITNLVVHSNVVLKDYCFQRNESLVEAIVNTTNLEGTDIFASCSKLQKIELPDTLSVLPKHMFWFCRALETIDIPSKVTRLEDSCFIYCNRLTSITLPETVTHLGNACFSGCEMLGDITCLATIAPTLDPNVFGNSIETYTGINATTKTLTVPSNATGYTSGDWQSVLQDKVGFTLKSIT